MFHRFFDRFGATGVVVVALLAVACVGGAFAAQSGSDKAGTVSCKAKIKGKKATVTCPTDQLAGAAGAVGPAGPKGDTGAAGPQGPQGPAGTNGTNGTNGTSVTASNENPGGNCANGGSKFQVGAGTPVFACNGADGQTGFTDTLPIGSTETGTWAISAGTADTFGAFTSLSFNIPIPAALGSSKVHYSTDANFTDFDGPGGSNVGCGGNVGNPAAPSGHLLSMKATYRGPR